MNDIEDYNYGFFGTMLAIATAVIVIFTGIVLLILIFYIKGP